MPNTDEPVTAADDAVEVVAAEAVAPAPPPPDPGVEMAKLREELARRDGMLSALREQQQSEAARRVVGEARPEPEIHEPTDEEIESAIADGKGAQALRQLQRASEARIRREQAATMAPLQQQLMGYGMPALAELTKRQTAATLDEYDTYKTEIEAVLKTVPAETLINPETTEWAYHAIIGKHHKEREAALVERTIRQMRENPADLPGRAGRTVGARRDDIPSAESLYGKDAASMIAAKGGEDAWARKNGYQGWKDFLDKTNDTEPPQGNA